MYGWCTPVMIKEYLSVRVIVSIEAAGYLQAALSRLVPLESFPGTLRWRLRTYQLRQPFLFRRCERPRCCLRRRRICRDLVSMACPVPGIQVVKLSG